ncbi:hypothetical protein GCM10022291_18420 [Postechiella marina]|uniref:YD repeat-containing protein n=1 Tax=Postechiella marina TaxID=943941 RepID=A0ABP8C8T3_9FLAO
MKKCLVIFSFILLYFNFGYAQELPEVIYPSPKAMDFEKYGNIPVSTYTGIPNISIPIYTIRQGDIQIPISLSYHASGIKVEPEAGEVGLGWVLNSGGIISRTIYGYNDFVTGGGNGNHYHKRTDILDITKTESATGNRIFPPNHTTGGPVFANNGSYDISDFLGEISGYDFEPDHYNYNFLGRSGRFVFSRDGTAHLSEKKELDIGFKNGLNNEGFIIYDGKGFKYTFDVQEKMHTGGDPLSNHVMSWLLKEIESPTGDKVTYNYSDLSNSSTITTVSLTQTSPEKSYLEVTPSAGNYALAQASCNSGTERNYFTESIHQNRYLESIDFDNGRLVFEYDNTRIDNNGKKLDKIELYTKDALGQLSADPIKEFELEYEYFDSVGGFNKSNETNYPGPTPSNDYNNKRLKLKEVIETGKQPYIFSYVNEYNANSFVGKGSFSKDYWDYYNASGASTLIPVYAGRNLIDDEAYSVLPGADRRANPSVVSNFSLESITYPTGGKTEFEYESNTYDFENSSGNIGFANFYEDKDVISPHSYSFFHNKFHDGEYKSDSFTINETVEIQYSLTLACDAYDPECKDRWHSDVTTLFKSLDGNYYDHSMFCVNNGTNQGGPDECNITGSFTLSPGTYSIESSLTGSGLSSLYANYKWRALKSSEELPIHYGGGQRVKKIYDYATSALTTPTNVREFIYHYTDPVTNNEKSYGKRISPLVFMTDVEAWYFYEFRPDPDPGLPPIPEDAMCRTVTRKSNNAISSSGNLIGYSKVIINHNTNGENGRTIEEYFCEPDVSEYYTHDIVIPPVPYSSNGLMLKRQDFSKESGNFIKVKEIENNYSSEPTININNSELIVGISRTYWNNHIGEPFTFDDNVYDHKSLFITYPTIKSDWIKLLSSTERTYDLDGTNPVVTTTNYDYDNEVNKLATQITTTNSKGEVLTSESKYAEDLNNTYLKSKHMHSIPLWQQQKIGTSIVSTTETEYAQSGLPLPTLIKTSKGTNIPLEPRVNFENYDDKGNILQVSKENGIKISYIWGYNKQYPVAKIENATYSQVEATGINLTTINNPDTSDSNMRIELNKIRNHVSMQNAMVTTYTYDPLIGVTSTTNPMGYTMYYEYDDFNRLKQVKDADGKILSQNQYHYKGQQ